MSEHGRVLLVDASSFITLSAIEYHALLDTLDGDVVIPRAVSTEITDDPAVSHLEDAVADGWILVPDRSIRSTDHEAYRHAASHLGQQTTGDSLDGDTALLAYALAPDSIPVVHHGVDDSTVVITDDKPLRETCRALGVEVSGSIGVLVVSVERGTLGPSEAKDALLAMDEVGARLSARLLRHAERLIDDAAASNGSS